MSSRPLFVYGTLQAKPLLAWALTGDAGKTDFVAALAQPATVHGYARLTIHGCEYPAVIRNNGSSVDGLLLTLTERQRKKLDMFEGEQYRAIQVSANRPSPADAVEAGMYLWDGDPDIVSSEPCELERFVGERLEDWIYLFEGMELGE